jgi:hypothetical protein
MVRRPWNSARSDAAAAAVAERELRALDIEMAYSVLASPACRTTLPQRSFSVTTNFCSSSREGLTTGTTPVPLHEPAGDIEAWNAGLVQRRNVRRHRPAYKRCDAKRPHGTGTDQRDRRCGIG